MDRAPRIALALLALAAAPARADDDAPADAAPADANGAGSAEVAPVVVPPPPPPPATLTDVHDLSSLGLYLGGAAIGFVAHESGHVVTNLLYGNVPDFERITTFGVIPFVAIDPRITCSGTVCRTADGHAFGGGRAGKYNIVTAGFDVQHITTEVLLTMTPDLAERQAPLRKGLFAFDLLLSVGYALSSVIGVESPYGDAANAADAAQMPRAAFAAILLAPAALDAYRYFHPRSRWAPWASRAAKGTLLGVSFAL